VFVGQAVTPPCPLTTSKIVFAFSALCGTGTQWRSIDLERRVRMDMFLDRAGRSRVRPVQVDRTVEGDRAAPAGALAGPG